MYPISAANARARIGSRFFSNDIVVQGRREALAAQRDSLLLEEMWRVLVAILLQGDDQRDGCSLTRRRIDFYRSVYAFCPFAHVDHAQATARAVIGVYALDVETDAVIFDLRH